MYRQIESLVEDKYVYRIKLNAAEEQKSNLHSELCSVKSKLARAKTSGTEEKQLKGTTNLKYQTCNCMRVQLVSVVGAAWRAIETQQVH